MDSAYRGRNYLSVKRTPYRGVAGVSEVKKNTAVKVSEKKNPPVNAKTAAVRTNVRDTYRVTSAQNKHSVPVSRKVPVVTKSPEKAKGFVYVEHSGFAGTFKDAFCTKRVKSKEKSCFDKIVLVLLFAVLMFFVAGSYCEYYEAFKTTNQIKTEIAECRDEQAKLLVAIEERNNALDIEGYAENVLGMVKSDKLTTFYINISDKDVVNIDINEEGEGAANGVLLSGFKSVMSNFAD